MKKYLLILMSFFMVILGITSFSNVENEKVPNELIINNPKKEVTTIESLKNREHGEMNISVTKINPIPITGIERDGKLEFELPEKVELEENIFVTDDVNKIQEHRTLKLNKNLTTFSLENQTEKTKLKVDKPSDSKKIYIAVKEQDKIKRVYENTYMNYNDTNLGDLYMRLDGRVYLDNMYDSQFRKVTDTNQIYYVGKDGKGNKGSIGNGMKFDLTIKTGISEYPNNIVVNGNPEFSSFYINNSSNTSQDRDYYYNTSGNFGLVLKKSINNLWWMAQGIDSSGIKLENMPGCKIPKRHVRGGLGAGAFDTFKVATKYTSNKEYYFTTKVYHAGDDINTFTKEINIDISKEALNSTIFLDGYFSSYRGDRHFLNCLYTQTDSEQKSENIIAAVMTVEDEQGIVKISDLRVPAKFPNFKVDFNNKYLFNYYQEWADHYGDRLHFSIKKLSENVGNKRFTIKVYSGRDYHILLGVLNLNIKNGDGPPEPPSPPTPVPPPPTPIETINIGSEIFNIDRRLVNRWIYGNKKSNKTLDNHGENYDELVRVDKFIINTNSTQINEVKVTNASYYGEQVQRGIHYKIFSTSWGKIAIPTKTYISILSENIAIYSNGSIPYNESIKLEISGSDNKKYIGNIEIKGIGSGIEKTNSTLDLSKYKKNQKLYWSDFTSSTVTGTFFKFKSVFNDNSVLTELKIRNNLGESTSGKKQGDGSIQVDFINNKIGVERNERIYIYKLSESNNPITYEIEGYYKEILLGTTTITITNEKKPIDIGTAKFEVDKRLESLYKTGSGRWIVANGDLTDGLTKNQFIKNYERLVKVTGFNKLPQNIKIIDGKVSNKTPDHIEYEYKNNYRYKIFKTNDGKNATAIPKVEFSQLNKALVIHKTNAQNIDEIILIGDNKNKYLGTLQQEFKGEDMKITKVHLDLSEWSIGQQESWSYPKKIDSTANKGKKANLVGGTFFHWRSYVNSNAHIITKLKIKENNKTPIEINNTNGKLERKFTNNTIGIDNTGLYIKKENDSSQPVTYIIEGYYENILLGKTTITITNQKNSFELVGDNTLDFGNMVYTSNLNEYREEKLFKVKNPSNANLKFSVASSIGNIQNGKDNLKLENIKISESKNSKKGESSFVLSASTRLEKGIKPGKYTGEIQVIVDIDGTGK